MPDENIRAGRRLLLAVGALQQLGMPSAPSLIPVAMAIVGGASAFTFGAEKPAIRWFRLRYRESAFARVAERVG